MFVKLIARNFKRLRRDVAKVISKLSIIKSFMLINYLEKNNSQLKSRTLEEEICLTNLSAHLLIRSSNRKIKLVIDRAIYLPCNNSLSAEVINIDKCLASVETQ